MTPIDQNTFQSDSSQLNWFDKKRFAKSPAILIGVYEGAPNLQTCKEHLQELKQLADTHEIPVIESIPLSMRGYTAATFLSTGKIAEVQKAIESFGAKLVIFDDEISPGQQRNLEEIFRIPVIDRTEVILGVFEDRASTKEAKLQVQLAQIKYISPRLKRMWNHLGQQTGGGGGSGGGGYLRGEGEKQIELDRRMLKDKLDRMQNEIKEVQAIRSTQRGLRERTNIPVFGIVGYTNAGKSTLLHTLTGADVFIENKLFATLDTTTRKCELPENFEALIIDTVGFIRKLPHTLVMAFRSTLEEATFADILIHVIDASHHAAPDQAKTTLEVLKLLNADKKPMITVFNKIDRLADPEVAMASNGALQKLKLTYPRSFELSCSTGEGLDLLKQEMLNRLKERRVRMKLRIPQSDYHKVSEAIREGNIINQEYDENDILIEVDLPRTITFHFEKYRI